MCNDQRHDFFFHVTTSPPTSVSPGNFPCSNMSASPQMSLEQLYISDINAKSDTLTF